MKRLLGLVCILALAACSGGGGSNELDPSESAASGVFGNWLFKATPQSTNCAGADSSVIEESYQITQTSDGCAFTAAGNGEHDLLSSDTVNCSVSGSHVTLSDDDTEQVTEACQAAIQVTGTLNLQGEQLTGSFDGQVTFSGSCGAMHNCTAKATIVATHEQASSGAGAVNESVGKGMMPLK